MGLSISVKTVLEWSLDIDLDAISPLQHELQCFSAQKVSCDSWRIQRGIEERYFVCRG